MDNADGEKKPQRRKKKAARRAPLDFDELEAEIIAELEGVQKAEKQHTDQPETTDAHPEAPEKEDASRKCPEPVEEESQTATGTKLKSELSQRLKPGTRTVMSNN